MTRQKKTMTVTTLMRRDITRMNTLTSWTQVMIAAQGEGAAKPPTAVERSLIGEIHGEACGKMSH